ncbi:low molecular weight phosphotyrosine protein phosphatase [Bacteriovoracaceae bacterium]|nr:low molecular weight phosphotyrosine protein phosphatase [Bacteriovoracaceae bacterium]
MKKILVVCLGNICRSPAAEAIFDQLILKHDLSQQIKVDSAGTSGYHVGELPDSRMRAELESHGYAPCKSHSRQINLADFSEYDHILVMDKSNFNNVITLTSQEEQQNKVEMMTDYADESLGRDFIPDPYYGGQEGFAEVISLLENSIYNFLNRHNQI